MTLASVSYHCPACNVRHAIGYRCRNLRSVRLGNVLSAESLALTRKVTP